MATPGIKLMFMKANLAVHDNMKHWHTAEEHEKRKIRLKKIIEDYKKTDEYKNWTRSSSYP